MELQVGNKKIKVDRVLLFGTSKRAYNLDGYVLNGNGVPLGYDDRYSDYKTRKVVNLNDIKPTQAGYFPHLTREHKALINAICDYAIVYKGVSIKNNERIKVLD